MKTRKALFIELDGLLGDIEEFAKESRKAFGALEKVSETNNKRSITLLKRIIENRLFWSGTVLRLAKEAWEKICNGQ